MDITKKVKVIGDLQNKSADVFDNVVHSLKAGMSEKEIAEAIKQEFKIKGIEEFWYNVPITVLIGVDRFKVGTTTPDYVVKNPSKDILLEEGSPLFIDLSPVDPKTKLWGDWSSMVIFHPRKKVDDEQVAFLEEMRQIHRKGISMITSHSTGLDVIKIYLELFKNKGITLLDVRKNVGHSIHSGPKDKTKRIWLDEDNLNLLGEGLFAVESGGFRKKKDGSGIIVGRFEECIYIPKEGNAILLGSQISLPLVV